MLSSLAWIDFDETERQRSQRILALFQEKDSRDELGLGSIRDSIADNLFPGTSTIQTRLRYMLFVPWIFQTLENSIGGSENLAAKARDCEYQLANALKAGGELNGIIGRDAGANLQRLPSSVYWAGLKAWEIRLFPGSIENLFLNLQRTNSAAHKRQDHESLFTKSHYWTASLPCQPSRLLETTNFELTRDEAGFLVDRLIASQPHSLLTHLARRDSGFADCDIIWEHPNLADFPMDLRILVNHGAIFSNVMHGASLLYNLMLSRLRKNSEWIEKYETQLSGWHKNLDMPALRKWSLDEFWNKIEHPTHFIRPTTKRFVIDWLAVLTSGGFEYGGQSMAERLVKDREQRLKTGLSRFSNRSVLDRWNGASGVQPLTYRWHQAKSHLRDLANAE